MTHTARLDGLLPDDMVVRVAIETPDGVELWSFLPLTGVVHPGQTVRLEFTVSMVTS